MSERVLAAAVRWALVRRLAWPTDVQGQPTTPRVAHAEVRRAERELEAAVAAWRAAQ